VSHTDALLTTAFFARMTGAGPAAPERGRSRTPAARPPSTSTWSTCVRSSTRLPYFSMPAVRWCVVRVGTSGQELDTLYGLNGHITGRKFRAGSIVGWRASWQGSLRRLHRHPPRTRASTMALDPPSG
jgi:hypothetical protein